MPRLHDVVAVSVVVRFVLKNRGLPTIAVMVIRYLLMATCFALVGVSFWTSEAAEACKKTCYRRCSAPARNRLVRNGKCFQTCDQISKNCRLCLGPKRCNYCEPGYTLSARTCVLQNRCLINNGGCSAHATCSIANKTVHCECRIGYKGDGVNCTANPCQIDAMGTGFFQYADGSCSANVSISLDAVAVVHESNCDNFGLIVVSVDPITCTLLSGPTVYTTFYNVIDPIGLAREWQETGTLFVAVTSGCLLSVGVKLKGVYSALQAACGVALNGTVSNPNNGFSYYCPSVAFVCEAGYPDKTIYSIVDQTVPDYVANVTAFVTGTGADMTINYG